MKNLQVLVIDQSKLYLLQNMSSELESLKLRITTIEKEITETNEEIRKRNGIISGLTDEYHKTDEDKKQMKLQKQIEMLQKQADGLREDRRSLVTQLSNLKKGNFHIQIHI